MALNTDQINEAWERRLEAETYALYFGDLANRYSVRKQGVTFISFFLASGAAAAILGKLPSWVPALMSVIVAIASAYSVAIALDRKILTMSKLHASWLQISGEYAQLWNHTYDDDAMETMRDLRKREQDLSLIATTDAPNDQKALSKWQSHVFKMYHLENA